eukprot:1495782-Rhodomonas_salina.1
MAADLIRNPQAEPRLQATKLSLFAPRLDINHMERPGLTPFNPQLLMSHARITCVTSCGPVLKVQHTVPPSLSLSSSLSPHPFLPPSLFPTHLSIHAPSHSPPPPNTHEHLQSALPLFLPRSLQELTS